jgi:hypothetical protein
MLEIKFFLVKFFFGRDPIVNCNFQSLESLNVSLILQGRITAEIFRVVILTIVFILCDSDQ